MPSIVTEKRGLSNVFLTASDLADPNNAQLAAIDAELRRQETATKAQRLAEAEADFNQEAADLAEIIGGDEVAELKASELLEMERDRSEMLRRELAHERAKSDVLVMVIRDSLERHQREQLAKLEELRKQNGVRP